jgi:1-deoxyxylulose-5-phosphate synthase
MEHVRMGGTGLRISRLGLGMMSYGDPAWRPWILDERDAEALVRQAVEAGVTFFDTADVYSLGVGEEVTGRLLGRLFSRREDYVVATKVCAPMGDGPNDAGLSRKHVLDSVDASLRRLGVDHIDLYQIHTWDPNTPIEETMRALDDVVRAGKVRYLGASNVRAWQLAKAQNIALVSGWTPFVSVQHHYNLLHREDELELLPMMWDQQLASLPFSPLARGVLARAGTGREASGTRYETDASAAKLYGTPDGEIIGRVAAVAEERGVPPAQVALAWVLHQPTVTSPMVGATRPGHLGDALAALDLELGDEELKRLEGAE